MSYPGSRNHPNPRTRSVDRLDRARRTRIAGRGRSSHGDQFRKENRRRRAAERDGKPRSKRDLYRTRRRMESNGPLLEARALTAFYGDFQALFDIDFRIERNETVAIIGSNGAGQSPLLTIIPALDSAN